MPETAEQVEAKWMEMIADMKNLRKTLRQNWQQRKDIAKSSGSDGTRKKTAEEVKVIQGHMKAMEQVDHILDEMDELKQITEAVRSNNTAEVNEVVMDNVQEMPMVTDNQSIAPGNNNAKRSSTTITNSSQGEENQYEGFPYRKILENGYTSYECLTCVYKAREMRHIIRHIDGVHQKVPKYACDKCAYLGCTMNSLKIHQKKSKHTSNDGKFRCTRCPYVAKTPNDWKAHGREHRVGYLVENNKTDKCQTASNKAPLCGKRQVYRKLHKGGKLILKCLSCPYVSGELSSIQQHIQRIHTKKPKYTCDECDHKATSLFNLRRHKRVHHGGGLSRVRTHIRTPLKCSDCGFESLEKMLFQNHLKMHGKVLDTWKCDKCTFVTPTHCFYKSHLLIHMHPECVICPHCGLAMRHAFALKVHSSRMHKVAKVENDAGGGVGGGGGGGEVSPPWPNPPPPLAIPSTTFDMSAAQFF